MAFDFHKDKETYIRIQRENAEKYVIPFIQQKIQLNSNHRVVEIGCAEGGVLKAFAKLGCHCTGIELMESRYEMAKKVLEEEIQSGRATLSNQNIYDVDIEKEFGEAFDLIILKDVIEHIHDQDKVLLFLRKFLKPNGHIFFGFPPWYMPFGGHQQIAKSGFLSKLPYYHLLPMGLYKGVLKLFGETPKSIEDLAEIKETGISIERFLKLIHKNNYSVKEKEFYLINPIYEYKFGLKPRQQFKWIAALPFIRNFFTTCVYFLVKKEEQ